MKDLVDPIVDAIKLAVTTIPADTVEALRRAYESEQSEIARFNLCNTLKAIEIGKSRKVPVCQDTGGTLTFFVKAGVESPYLGEIEGGRS